MAEPMSAVALVGPLPPPAGGMANQTAQLARLLERDGVVVEVVRTNAPYRPRWVGRVRVLRALFRLVPYLAALWRASGRADVVHVMANSGWSWHLMAAPAVWIASLRRVPAVINYRGGAAAAFFSAQWRWVAPTVRRAAAVVVPSPFLRRVFAAYGVEARIVRNIVEPSSPGPVRARRPGGGPVVLVARNLEAIYGVDDAIASFARIVAAFPGAQLRIAGDGPERAALEARAASLGLDGRVRFLGRLENRTLLAEMSAADVLLNASRVDNTPISILEAHALGVPVVSTAAGGIPDLVRDGETGLLAPVGDVEALAFALHRVLGDAALRSRLVRAGREVARAHGWPAVREALYALYEGVSGGRFRRPCWGEGAAGAVDGGSAREGHA